MNSEPPSRSRVVVPPHVRWREFRIQLLPLLAFGSALVLAGVVWQQLVRPISVVPSPPSSAGLAQSPDADPPLENTRMEQASHRETNEIARAPRD